MYVTMCPTERVLSEASVPCADFAIRCEPDFCNVGDEPFQSEA